LALSAPHDRAGRRRAAVTDAVVSLSGLRARLDILPAPQRALLPELAFTTKLGFALYGGTAIALRLGHRTSVDFDFFNDRRLDKTAILRDTTLLDEGLVTQDEDETLTLSIVRGGRPVKVSFFGNLVPRRIAGRVGDIELTDDGILAVASLDDLFATKVKVVLDRAEAKEYADIAALLRAGGSLDRALSSARAIFRCVCPHATSCSASRLLDDGSSLFGRNSAVARARMIRAAFTSAWSSCRHETHTNRSPERFSLATCPHRAHVCELYRESTLTTRRAAHAAFSRMSVPNMPKPASSNARLRPVFAATFVPGSSIEPRADRVMLRSASSSIAIRS
jgi:hypothetical protein